MGEGIENKNNQEEINLEFYEICNELSNIANTKINYMEYISALLYIKYSYTEHKEKIFQDDYFLTEGKEWLANVIDDELEQIRQNENRRKLFSNIKFRDIINTKNRYKLTNTISRLKKLIMEIEKKEINSKKIIAEAYRYAIMREANNNELKFGNGEFYTPKGLVKTMINLLDIEKQGTIYDPACGSGNFLVEACKKNKVAVVGEEEDISGYNICMTNMLLNDIKNYNIVSENIYQDNHEKYNYIVTNPPFSGQNDMKEWNEENAYKYNITKSSKIYTKFLVNMIEKLEEDGTMAIILPHGILFRETERYLREKLVRDNIIEAIIGLPENLFPGTRISVIVLVIKKNRKNSGILFIDASNEFISKRKNNILTVENQDKIIKTYKNYEVIDNYSYVADEKEIEANEYNLSIKKYVKPKEEKELINKEEITEQIDNLEGELIEIQKQIRELLNE